MPSVLRRAWEASKRFALWLGDKLPLDLEFLRKDEG